MPNNPLISKVTLPSNTTYRIKDGYVWGQAMESEIFQILASLFHGDPNETLGDGETLAYALMQLNLQINGSDDSGYLPIEPHWSEDASFPDTIKNKTIVEAIISLASAVQGLTPGGESIVFRGAVDDDAASPLYPTDGGSQNIQVNNTTITFSGIPAGSLYFYKQEEFIKGTDGEWHSLGPQLQALGALAYKASASASYTPAGTVSKPTFTGTQSTVTITTATTSSGGNYTPAGTVSGGQLTLNALSSTGAYTPGGTVSKPTFSGTAATITAKGTPTGTVSKPTFTGTAATITSKNSGTFDISASFSGTAATITTKGTPAGTVSKPNISVQTAGATSQVKQVSGITQMFNAFSVANPGASAPSNAIAYVSYDNETLILNQIGATKANPVSTANVTVKTGDAAYQLASAPTFTGAELSSTAAYTPHGTITASIPANAFTVSGTYTPGGTVSQPTFSGAQMSATAAYTPGGTVSQPTFSGTAATITVSGTPSGSVSSLGFTGQQVKITGTVTPSGTVSQPTFTGKTSTITVS